MLYSKRVYPWHFPDYRNVSRPRQMVGGAVEWERRGRKMVKRRRRRVVKRRRGGDEIEFEPECDFWL